MHGAALLNSSRKQRSSWNGAWRGAAGYAASALQRGADVGGHCDVMPPRTSSGAHRPAPRQLAESQGSAGHGRSRSAVARIWNGHLAACRLALRRGWSSTRYPGPTTRAYGRGSAFCTFSNSFGAARDHLRRADCGRHHRPGCPPGHGTYASVGGQPGIGFSTSRGGLGTRREYAGLASTTPLESRAGLPRGPRSPSGLLDTVRARAGPVSSRNGPVRGDPLAASGRGRQPSSVPETGS